MNWSKMCHPDKIMWTSSSQMVSSDYPGQASGYIFVLSLTLHMSNTDNVSSWIRHKLGFHVIYKTMFLKKMKFKQNSIFKCRHNWQMVSAVLCPSGPVSQLIMLLYFYSVNYIIVSGIFITALIKCITCIH